MNRCTVFCLFLVVSGNAAQSTLNKLCSDNLYKDSCEQVERDQDIKCQEVLSKTECILDIDRGLPTLSILNAEEAFLAAPLVSSTTTVFGEIVPANTPYQTAVVVRSGYLGGFEPLRGLKYCHPGYNHDERITKFVLEQLDWKAINLSCDTAKTLTEQKFQALSSLFGSSCRPGKWSQDDTLDSRLKKDFPSLCELCGTDGCATTYNIPLNDTLSCLTDNGGDIALTALRYADTFFSIGANAQNFQYLCPNGTLAPSSNPCTWTNQLNRLLITSNESAHVMTNYVKGKLGTYLMSDTPSSSSSVFEAHFARLLQLSRSDQIKLVDPIPLYNYVSERRTIPLVNESIQCGLTVNWSVTAEIEKNKCIWLQQASLNNGLQPVVSCVLSLDNDTVSNLDNIKQGKADLAFTNANFGYVARKKQLINIAYPETHMQQLSKIVIVVRNDTTWFKNFTDLKGRPICLPEYGGKEWLSFIDLLRSNNVVNNSCEYGKIFSEFVGQSCAPGANSKDLGISNTDVDKLCYTCYSIDATQPARYCNADPLNKFYDSLGALTCLKEASGDYAVIDLNDLPYFYSFKPSGHQEFTVIAKNGSLASYNGFNVDEDALISIIVAGEVIVKNGTAKFNDIQLYLREIEQDFALNLKKSFKLFEEFNHTKNVLFPDSTPGLTFSDSGNKYIQNYRTLLEHSETCSADNNTTGGSDRLTVPVFFAVFILTVLVRLV
ncbi:unnamed protein product [Ceutorhynchus assimilis]|uniref:Transferrin-like domain-containing protein n=1 Tax=Ceutorhynchus assimilis TaxID=467358 RepID=A0A9P0DID5_9CUCU|nr:unnamed protein product [Ceutorhynchus assimilis]